MARPHQHFIFEGSHEGQRIRMTAGVAGQLGAYLAGRSFVVAPECSVVLRESRNRDMALRVEPPVTERTHIEALADAVLRGAKAAGWQGRGVLTFNDHVSEPPRIWTSIGGPHDMVLLPVSLAE